MEISYQVVLRKMEEKINEAKSEDSDARIREHVQAIKALCEVILDEPAAKISTSPVVKNEPVTMVNPSYRPQQSFSLGEKRLVEEDGSNGESLFDF